MSTEYIKPLVLPYSPDETFSNCFKRSTAGPDSIGAHYTREMMQRTVEDPLLVVTSTDLVLFPGGRPQATIPKATATETGALSKWQRSRHVGAAVPWLIPSA